MKNLNPKDFKKFFSTPVKVRCFNASFLLRSSIAKADVFLTYKKCQFEIYINKNKEIICGKEGIKIYSSEKRYKKYSEEFRKSVDYGNKIFVARFGKPIKKLTKKQFQEAFNYLQKFWYLYGMSEFPYQDMAYKKAEKENNKAMKRRLNLAGEYKFTARKLMNKFFFKKGVIENLVSYVSNNILESKNGADYLFIEELLKTFDGWRPNKKLMQERSKCYSATSINGELIIFSYKKAIKLNKEFTEYKDTNMIGGIVASPGRAIGRAIISPMLDDDKAIEKINKKMKKGDILIAETTSPDTLMLCNKAAAIVAEQSGLLSHAAVVSRERKIPCVIQVTNSTKIIKNGDLVEVDANKGIVRILDKKRRIATP
ncbi:MAG TPA: PEP-utilizing enzyme [Candidatus Moranbacteria bacterium]|nr:PEP-utilizing enzyme [Candidatus Moranbacteria bacterium]